MFDEPFADSSQLPTALVMALARQQVTVALSGDGGDELFGGYNRYIVAPKVFRVLRRLPEPLRRTLSRLLLSVPPARWDGLLAPLARLAHQTHLGDKLHKLGNRLVSVRNPDELYVALVTEWTDADLLRAGAAQAPTLLSQREDWPRLDSFVSRMMALDALTYLPDDILVKVDRAAMAASLETRAPFLDHRVVELAWRLPLSHKIGGNQGKLVLRKILSRHLPDSLIDRPKMGFAIPLDTWLRTDLRDWAESLLSSEALSASGLVEPEPVRLAWEQHLSGRRSIGYRLWSVLMLQAWWQQNGRSA
jgi:asparagine synthase (glutamine-hydrolysing)